VQAADPGAGLGLGTWTTPMKFSMLPPSTSGSKE
jgi:hypothetical protein